MVLLNWKAFSLRPSFASMIQAIAPQCFGELYLSNPTCSRREQDSDCSCMPWIAEELHTVVHDCYRDMVANCDEVERLLF